MRTRAHLCKLSATLTGVSEICVRSSWGCAPADGHPPRCHGHRHGRARRPFQTIPGQPRRLDRSPLRRPDPLDAIGPAGGPGCGIGDGPVPCPRTGRDGRRLRHPGAGRGSARRPAGAGPAGPGLCPFGSGTLPRSVPGKLPHPARPFGPGWTGAGQDACPRRRAPHPARSGPPSLPHGGRRAGRSGLPDRGTAGAAGRRGWRAADRGRLAARLVRRSGDFALPDLARR